MTDADTDADVAILHDRFPGIGGGEEFAIEAARVLEASIYLSEFQGFKTHFSFRSSFVVEPLKSSGR